MTLTYGSLFAGVGGFDQGFDRAGMECRWQCERDQHCQKLLQKKWPNAKLYDDITTIRAGELERVDVICGGSPCQDLSVAGLRAGMAGGRSGLFHQMVRICKRVRPRFVVWENVDGAFSSNGGRDFAAVLRAFTGVQVEVPVDGWGRAGFIKTPFPAWRWHCTWRVFDAQYFGVPQRRRRVFLVASLGDGRCAQILFEPESLRGDSPPSRDAGERVAPTIASRPTGGGGLGTDFDCDGGLVPLTSYALTARAAMDRLESGACTLIPEVAGALDFGGHGGSYNGQDAHNGKLIPIAFSSKDSGGDAGPIAPTLRACGHKESHANGGAPVAVAFPIQSTVIGRDPNGPGGPGGPGFAANGDPMFTLDRCGPHAVAHSLTANGFDASEDGTGRGTPILPVAFMPARTLAKDGGIDERFAERPVCDSLHGSSGNGNKAPVIFQEAQTGVREYDSAGTLRANGPGHDPVGSRVREGMAVRRLTPKECERLMGWPDDHTAGFSDSTRYKMCGNGIVASVSAWIGKRIVKFSA